MLKSTVLGAHPVLLLERLAGFSHPRNPKISRTVSALIALEERNFLLRKRIPQAQTA